MGVEDSGRDSSASLREEILVKGAETHQKQVFISINVIGPLQACFYFKFSGILKTMSPWTILSDCLLANVIFNRIFH